jgi:hypothetical protein
MILTIIFTLLFIIITTLLIVYCIKVGDWVLMPFEIIVICLLLPLMIVAINNGIAQEIQYQKYSYERETLEYRLEQLDTNITGNELLYKEITSFNNDLRGKKYWGNNVWTNWLYNQKVIELDYIEIPKN